jgi:hypothetical protein
MTSLSLSLFASLVLGQASATPVRYSAPAPTSFSASFDSLYKDFGTVPYGSQSIHRFTFTNKSDKEVRVLGVRSSCHCATPRAVNDTAGPGEKIEIEVLYDAKKFVNERSMTITVDMQSDRHESVFLQVRGFSRTDVTLEPGKVDLGVVKVGTEQTHTVRLDYTGGRDWRIQDVIAGKWAKAKVEEKSRSHGLVRYEVTLTVPKDAPRGGFVDAVQLKTNDPSSPVVRVDVVGTLDGGIQPSLSTVKFGEAEAGKPVKKRLFIKGDQPFSIASAAFDASKLPISLQSTQGQKTVHTLEIEFNAAKAGDFEETLHIKAEPSGELVPIKIFAKAK